VAGMTASQRAILEYCARPAEDAALDPRVQYDSGGFGGTPTLRLYVKRGQSSTAPDPLEVDAGDVAWLLGGGYLRRLQDPYVAITEWGRAAARRWPGPAPAGGGDGLGAATARRVVCARCTRTRLAHARGLCAPCYRHLRSRHPEVLQQFHLARRPDGRRLRWPRPAPARGG